MFQTSQLVLLLQVRLLPCEQPWLLIFVHNAAMLMQGGLPQAGRGGVTAGASPFM